MIIQHNMTASNTSRMLGITTGQLSKSAEKLSSGYRINRAGDDAAGLSISEKMRGQIRGLEMGSKNAQDGVSFIQTTEGAMDEVHALLQRGRELSVQAANDTNASEDRDAIQKEINQIIKEVDRIASDTEFNTIKCFSTDGVKPTVNGASGQRTNEIRVVNGFAVDGSTETSGTPSASGTTTSYTGAMENLAKDVEKYAENAASQILSKFSSLNSVASQNTIGVNLGSIDGANGTLASASLRMGYGSVGAAGYTDMSYTLNIDTSDFNPSSYNKGELASTIAHEMMHTVMYDSLTTGMVGSDKYPQWFIEGTAQTMGGGFTAGHNAGLTAMSDSQMKSYLENFKSDVYGAGYIATMYLGAAVNAGTGAGSITTVNSSDIASGLDTLFSDIAGGKTLDQAIADNTKYSGLGEFQRSFASDAVTFAKNLATTVGSGAGSLLTANLSDSSSALEASYSNAAVTSSSAATKFNVDTSSTSFKNHFGVMYNGTSGGGAGSSGGEGTIHLQVGANAKQSIDFDIYDISSSALGLSSVGVLGHDAASNAITSFDNALKGVSDVRSYYGAIQNRLEHSIANTDNTAENLQAAESRIRDVNMADEMVKYSKNSILQQAAQSMLAQANQSTSGVLSIIQ